MVVLFNQVIPSLPPGVLVHVHDICLPYDYPAEYQRRLYTEQYLLQALLAHSPRYRIQLSTHGLCRNAPARVQREFGPAAASDPLHFGGALWFEVVDPA